MSADALPRGLILSIRTVGIILFTYMAYATFFGPYKTTVVHLALFAAASLFIAFLSRSASQATTPLKLALDLLAAAAAVGSMLYLVVEFERILNVWGSGFLTEIDIWVGLVMVAVYLEAARRQSIVLAVLSLCGVCYMLWGNHLSGVFAHGGMDVRRFVYIVAYTGEGIFGVGLQVAATYLFMFMMLGATLRATKTGDFIINAANAALGNRTGGAAKGAMVASAGLGTMVGSSVGNVVTTGAFTIPMMIRTGFKPHTAAAVETNTSEGAQFVPPIMGAGAFLMAQLTGIPYVTIAVAAILPAALYYLSLYWVVHIEALRQGIGGIPKDQLPNFCDSLRDGWHLLVAPCLLFYLLIFEKLTPNYAALISIGAATLAGMARITTRATLSELANFFDAGTRQAAAITALVISIGILQASIVATGLGPRLSDIILSVSDGSLIVTACLAVVAATVLGMGMPTPIAYLLLALFAAPAMIAAGGPLLGTHLFLFYFAIKSGSTPPVALVAVVAAGIAKANWWSTAVTAFVHSLPGFIIAFMFLYSEPLLMQGSVMQIITTMASACVGVFAAAAGIQGWCGRWIGPLERLILVAAAISLISPGHFTDVIGVSVVALVLLRAKLTDGRGTKSTSTTNQQT